MRLILIRIAVAHPHVKHYNYYKDYFSKRGSFPHVKHYNNYKDYFFHRGVSTGSKNFFKTKQKTYLDFEPLHKYTTLTENFSRLCQVRTL